MLFDVMYRSMFDELKKLAEDSMTTGQKALAGGGVFLGANLAAQPIKHMAAKRFVRGIDPSKAPMQTPDVKNLIRKVSPTTGATNMANPLASVFIPKGGILPKALRPAEELLYSGMGVSSEGVREGFRRGVAAAPLGHSPEFLAHELGHASLRDPKKTGLLMRGLIKGRALGPLAGMIAASGMAVQDPESATAQLAPVAAGAGMVPMLTDEAMASRRGMQGIRSLGKFSPEIIKKMRGNLGRAFGTYGGLAAGMTLPMLAFTQWRARRAQNGA